MTVELGSLDQLVAGKEIIVACGPGGVGKTTAAAALGVATALRSTAKVLVLTVDPARRLGDALGLTTLEDAPRRVDAELFAPVRRRARGELWAAMVDTRASWDALVRNRAPDRSTAEAILSNPFYRNITGRFAHSHEYIAMERLYELHAAGNYDLLILDTPPSNDALDLLDAPEKMAEFFSSHLLRLLGAPGRSRLVSAASRPFVQVADRLLGRALMQEIAAFLGHFEAMRPGFIERANAVSALVRGSLTTFMIVTTLEAAPAREAQRLAVELDRRGIQLGLVVANKVLPGGLLFEAPARAADQLEDDAVKLAAKLKKQNSSSFSDAASVARVLSEISANSARFALVARRQAEILSELTSSHAVNVRVPHLFRDIVDVDGLVAIGEHLFDVPV